MFLKCCKCFFLYRISKCLFCRRYPFPGTFPFCWTLQRVLVLSSMSHLILSGFALLPRVVLVAIASHKWRRYQLQSVITRIYFALIVIIAIPEVQQFTYELHSTPVAPMCFLLTHTYYTGYRSTPLLKDLKLHSKKSTFSSLCQFLSISGIKTQPFM